MKLTPPETESEADVIPPSIWHNGGKRLLKILIGISCVILLLCASVALGIFVLTDRVTKLQTRVEDVAGNQSAVSNRVDANTEAIKDYEEAMNEGWKKFQDHNPTLPVPQVTETDPSKPAEKADIVVLPPKATPRPTPLPKEVRVKTVIKYKTKPTPWPWWKPKPQPTPKK